MTTTKPSAVASRNAAPPPLHHAFMIAWSRSAPQRVGEFAIFAPGTKVAVIGRGGVRDDDPGPRLTFGPSRGLGHLSVLEGSQLSRSAVHVHARGSDVAVHHVRGASCRVNGRVLKKARLELGDRIALGDDLLLILVKRPLEMPAATYPEFPFGEPDAFGWVGESLAAWELRRELMFLAARDEHALVHGPTGAGKALVVNALHGLSGRAKHPLVVRSSATLAPDWTSRELFGTAAGFPDPGAPARQGLIEEAAKGTLVLDDLDCACDALQTQLLGLLDRGEYHQPGDPSVRKATVRLVAATKAPDVIRSELRARFLLDVQVPDVAARREDVPLLLRHVLKKHLTAARGDEARFLLAGEPRVHIDLVSRLLEHEYTEGVRELSRLALQAMATSQGDDIELTPNVVARLKSEKTTLPGRDVVREALERNEGNISRTWQELGLSSRHVLNRLVRRYGIRPSRSIDTE